jgi:hypothetical protein
MDYLAPLVPAMTLAGLPLVDRREGWALSQQLVVAAAEPAGTEPLTPTGSGELG